MSEPSEMQKPTWYKENITLGNIITGCVLLVTFAFGYGQMTANNNASFDRIDMRISAMEKFRDDRTKNTDARFDAIMKQLEGMPNLTYRVTANEEALKGTNARVDQSLSNISARLGEINQSLGSLDTKVAVLTQRFENSLPQRRAETGQGPGR